MSYHLKKFRSVTNSEHGTVDERTLFNYRQKGTFFWGNYSGGSILIGTMIGSVDEQGILKFTYCHQDETGRVRRGSCISIPEILPDGRIRLFEEWQWKDGERSKGSSVVEEIKDH